MSREIQAFPVNGPFDDPAVYVRLPESRGAFLFDLGDLSPLTPRQLLRVTDVFVTHTHIDHFVGFDQLLRIFLGRDRRVRIVGPRGIIGQVRGKLSGYTWNLVEDYRLELEVVEFTGRYLRRMLFTCRSRFRERRDLGREPSDGVVLDMPRCQVRAAILGHHGLPCLGFRLNERLGVHVHPDRLEAMGVRPGPWLTQVKEAVIADRPGEIAETIDRDGLPVALTAAEWVARAATVTRGRTIAYVSDADPTPVNAGRIVDLVRGADLLFCETPFLDADRERALQKGHLTAKLAGRLAGEAGVRRLEIFHISPRYLEREGEVREEARTSFETARAGLVDPGAP